MSRGPEQIAAEAFKRRPRTAQISVWLDDSGSLHAVAPDHANGGLVQIKHPWLNTPEAVASFQKIWAALLVEEKAQAEKERLSRARNFDCPDTESRCTEGECTLTRCVRHERFEAASRRRQQEGTRLGKKVISIEDFLYET